MERLAMRRHRVSATLGTLLLLTALAAPVAAQAPIKIGEINSFSGIGAPFTGPYRQAVEMAVEEVNAKGGVRSEEHTSELQSLAYLVCRLLLEKKKNMST